MKQGALITKNMFEVLRYMALRAPNGMAGVMAVARETHLSPSTASILLQRLKELGLVDGGNWREYKVTLRGKLLVDILAKRDWSDEELLRYWVKAVIRPRLTDMMAAVEIEQGA